MTIVGGRELTVGQLAARAGVAVSALHFYEAKGLIRARRTSGNQRRYSRDTLRRIAFIRIAQRVGIPLATIGEALASLPEDLQVYSSAPDDIRQALSARIVQSAQKISGHHGARSARKS